GKRGPIGINWRNEPWAIGVEYATNDALYYDGSSYRAKTRHVAGPDNVPGVGPQWELIALGTDVDTAQIVAGIADEVETVAGIAPAVSTVAGIADNVTTV